MLHKFGGKNYVLSDSGATMTQAQTNIQYFSPAEMMAEAEKFALSKAKKAVG